jgi:hypothetical protein
VILLFVEINEFVIDEVTDDIGDGVFKLLLAVMFLNGLLS